MKKKVYTSLMVFFLFTINSFSQDEQTKKSIRENIDWLNTNNNAPTQLKTYLHPVPIGNGVSAVRGPLGATSCLNYATIFAIAGQTKNAVQWLQAGQDHNQGVQDLFATYPDYCANYIAATYKNQAAVSFGLGPYYEWISTALGEIQKHNPPIPNNGTERTGGRADR